MKIRRKKASSAEVDMSPLIDMVFILLIFFMVSTTFTKDMKLDLQRPGASSASKASTKAIRVYIDNFGETYVDNQPIKTWAIQSKVRELLHSSAQASVLVIADDTIPVEKLIEVVDQCRLSGASDVAVVTEKEAG